GLDRGLGAEQFLNGHSERLGEGDRDAQGRVRLARLDRRDGLPRNPGHPRELLLGQAPGLTGEPQLGPADHLLFPVFPVCPLRAARIAVMRPTPAGAGLTGTATPSGPKRGGSIAVTSSSRPTGIASGSRAVTVTSPVLTSISHSAPAARHDVTTPARTRPSSGY